MIPAAFSGSEQTFRAVIKPTVSGKSLSVHFSNVLGKAPVTIGAAHIGIVSAGAALTADAPLTFSGHLGVTIPAGGGASSDAVAFSFPYGARLAVTEYLSGSWTSLPQHNSVGLWTNYSTAAKAGNRTGDAAGTAFTQTTNEAYLVDRLDTIGDYKETVAFIGSSTTAGFGSTPNAYNDVVDDIADNLHAAGIDTVGLANLALIPDPLLPQNDMTTGGNQSAIERFTRDAASLPGIAIVVQNAADVDLKGDCDSAQSVIAGERQITAAAHAANIKIVLALVAPSTYCGQQNPSGFGSRFAAGSGQDAQRVLLNDWLRSTTPSTVNGVAEAPPAADGFVDIATPVTDPANTGYMLPQDDSGDDSHPNAAGQARQAAAFPATFF